MKFVNWIIHQIANHFGLNKALEKFNYSMKLGESSKIAIPKEVMAVSMDFAARGLLNQFAIQTHLDWIMPYWVNEQYNIESRSFIPATVLSTNIAHRNWTAIGSLEAKREPIVDPVGMLTCWYDGWSLEFWIGKNKNLIVPSRITDIYQYLVKQVPIVVTQFIDSDVRIRMEAFVKKCFEKEIIYDSILLENIESIDVELSLFVCIRPYNPEGISPINKIKYIPEKNVFQINEKAGVFLNLKPDRVFCSNQKQGDAAVNTFSGKTSREIVCQQGLATAFAEYKLKLAPNEVKEIEVRALTTPQNLESIALGKIHSCSYQEMKKRTVADWEKIVGRGLTINIPYQKMLNSFLSNKAHLYLFIDDNVITPGPYTYHSEYFRDAAYSITALERMGYTKEAEKILLHYPNRQETDGYFLSQEGEWDSNGQALWTYYQHYKYTKNIEFVNKIYNSAYLGFQWIRNKREKKTGLLPAGYSAEHFGPNDTFYWDNFWSLAGIKGLLELTEILGYNDTAEEIRNEYDNYSKAVFEFIKKDSEKFSMPIIPSSPNRNIDSSIIGSICVLYPLRLLSPRDPRITGTLRVIREKYQKNQAFFHQVIHSGYNVYLTAQLAQCYLYRKSLRVLPLMQWILDNITSTGCFPEAIHPITGGGCMGDGHHGWAGADLLNLIRNILFFEEDNNLVITPILYHRWMEAGEILEVKNAPSYFGIVNFRIEGKSDKIILSLQNSYSEKPGQIEFSIPFMIKKATVDKKDCKIEKTRSIKVPADAKEIVVYR